MRIPAVLCEVVWKRQFEVKYGSTRSQSRMHCHPSFARSFANATTKVTHQCSMQYHNVPGIHRWTMKGFHDLVLFANNDWGTLLCMSFLGSQCVVDSHIVMVISCATSAMHIHFLGVFPPCQLHLLHARYPIASALSGDRSRIQIFTVHCICQVRT